MPLIRRRADKDTIGLVGDGDDEDLIRAIEESFRVKFGDDTASWFTAGDIYNALLTRVPVSSTAGLCATSMAFYRLRAALTRISGVEYPVKPSTKLAGLMPLPPKRLFAKLSDEFGVEALPLTMSWWGSLGALALLIGFLGFIYWPLLLLFPAGGVMISTDVGAYYSTTVGDLARKIATRNFTLFASAGADSRPEMLWRALCAIIADETNFDAGHISPSTRLVA